MAGHETGGGRSYRRYLDEAKAAKALIAAGFEEEKIYTKSLLGITAMEKLVGKNNSRSYWAPVVKPPGKPKLAPESDKRPAIKSTAEIDFKDV